MSTSNPTIAVTSKFLLAGAVYALEQCGLLLRDANTLYRGGSYGTALTLAAFAREELGRASILFELRTKIIADEIVTLKTIIDSCRDHITKQNRAVMSTEIMTDSESILGKLLQTRFNAKPQSKERKQADEELSKITEIQRRRAPQERHQLRMRGLYVEPEASGTRWHRPQNIDQKTVHDFLNHAVTDYAGQLQRIEPELLKGYDDKLIQELKEWHDRPTPPKPEWPDRSD